MQGAVPSKIFPLLLSCGLRVSAVTQSSLQATPARVVPSRGFFSSTVPVWKGRRGGSSVLRPKQSPRGKLPGQGKKKKPKVHGAPMSRITKDRQAEEKGRRDLERFKTINLDDTLSFKV